jgi:DNA polymerase elongation subunit (family B)
MEAVLFDAYPTTSGMVLWLLQGDGSRVRATHPWAPRFYYAGPRSALARADAALRGSRIPLTTRPTVRRDLLRGDLAVVEVAVANPLAFSQVVTRLARIEDLVLYNCDIPLPQMYLYDSRLFPLGRCAVDLTADGTVRSIAPLDSPWDREYALPPLAIVRLRLDGDPVNPNHGHRAVLHIATDHEASALTGDTPEDLLRALTRWLERHDPDVILTEWGDSFLFPRLRRLARRYGYAPPFNRDPEAGVRTRRPRSYVTYGHVAYTAGGVYLHGRWHLDTANSFIYEEAELPGLLELARVGRMPVQHVARTSVGTVITSMQLDQAYQEGILIPWRKSRPEAFKSAADLLLTDRGGLTYTPLIGAYEQVGELDFAAMYPALMTRFNISQETVNCPCCREDPEARVPGIPHHLCRRAQGLIPRVLERVLARRRYYKERRAATQGAERRLYDMRQTALKWIGVVCLGGATRVLHRSGPQWRVAPIREIVEAYLPGDAAGVTRVHDLAVVGVDRRLRLCVRPVRRVVKVPAPPTMLQVALEGHGHLLVTPDHPCYVVGGGGLRVDRADRLRTGQGIPVATSWDDALTLQEQHGGGPGPALLSPGTPSAHRPLGIARILSVRPVPSSEPFVYCLEVAGEPAAFFVEDGVLTHNCFGYQGYRNARFGQIEAHECTTALAREMLLRAKDVAESRGFRMLHALVDSVWLHREGATRGDFEALAAEIQAATDMPIAVEGVYRWIAFVPSRTHPRVGVPNRYFGVFEDGTTKVRGIEVRQSNTPPLVADAQARMLATLFEARTLEEVRARLPRLQEILEEALTRLRQHDVRPEELVIRTVLSRAPQQYQRGVPQAVAAHRLAEAGVVLHPGEAIDYIIADAGAPVRGERAVPYARLPADWAYDAEWYARALLRAAETLLAPFRAQGF